MRSTRLLALASLVLAACPPPTSQTETLQLSPASLELQTGELRTVTAQVKAGTAAAGTLWSSSDVSVVSVTSTGDGTATVQGVSAGTATVSTQLRNLTATLAVTVTARTATLLRVELTPAGAALAAGTFLQLGATGILTDDTRQDLTSTATWASADATILTVSAAGLVSGLKPGATRVTATKDGVTGTLDVTVTAAILSAIDVTPASPALARGTSQQLRATARFSDTTTQDVTAQVTWSSSSAAIATVDAGGKVSAREVGSAILSAEVDGVTGSTTLTVTGGVLMAIDLTPAAPVVPLGLTAPLTATGRFSDGTTQDLTTQATWASGALSVATVSSVGVVTGLTVGTARITASVGAISGSTTLTVTAAQLVSLDVTPAAATLARGLTRALTATATFSDTSTQDLTGSVTWSSSAPSVASISNATGSAGLVTGQAAGVTTLSATSGTVSGSTTLSVTAGTVASLQISPTAPTLPQGLTQAFTATGILSDATMQDVTASVTWTTGSAAVASISNAAGSEGRLTAAGVGSTTVVATIGSVTADTTLTVTAAVLVSIAVTPAAPSLVRGGNQQFVATGTYSDASTQIITASVTWASSATAALTVSNLAGSEGLAHAAAAGTSTLSATSGSVSGSTLVTVTNPALVSIAVAPATPSLAKGRPLQFTATGTFADSSTQDLTGTVTWNSATPAAATLSTGGLVSAVDVGTSVISATSGLISGSTTLTVGPAVLESIAVTPATPSVAMGLTQQFVAMGTLSDATTQNLSATATWGSATGAVASVSSSGLATALTVGTSSISATSGSVVGNTTLTVTAAQLVSIAVTPATPTVGTASTQQMTATGTYTDTSTLNLSATATWLSASPAFVTVNATGLVTGVTAGTSLVSATSGIITGSTTVTVAVSPPVVLSSVPLPAAVQVSALAGLSVTFDRAMAPATLTAQATGGSCTGNIQVSRDGFATCIGLGAPVLSGGNTIASTTPLPALVFGVAYQLRVTTGVTSAAGIAMAAAYTAAFTTAVDGHCATGLVISQVYGGGGNSGAPYTNDFIELHNPTPAAISLNGMAVQYLASAGTTWTNITSLPNVSVPAGGYFLVQEASGGAVGVALPTADATGTISLAATAGKVALTSSAVALSGSCPTGGTILDFVGYGAANCSEGAPTGTLSNTTSAQRKKSGCGNENNNSLDYAVAAPAPRSTASASAPLICACSLNETDLPNEADFCNLQFPPTIVAATGTASPIVYGRLYEASVTPPAGADPSVRAQIGYGPATANPENQSGWVWTNASFNTQIANNDEYQATFITAAAGDYRYTARFSFDGVYWTYCDLDGAGSNAGLTFDLTQLGVMTVTP